MRKNLVFLYILSALLLSVVLPLHAFAHFSQTDGDLTVTLHVEPDDDPTPEQQAYIYFLFDDVTKRFSLAKCNCTVSISEKEKQLYKQQLIEKKESKPSIWGTSILYVFPKNDVYHILLIGKPKSPDEFQPFTLSWYFRVNPGNSGIISQRPSDIPMIIASVFGITIFLILFGIFIKKEIIDGEEVDKNKKNKYNKKRL